VNAPAIHSTVTVTDGEHTTHARVLETLTSPSRSIVVLDICGVQVAFDSRAPGGSHGYRITKTARVAGTTGPQAIDPGGQLR
jgi:hypothetical protein